MKKILIVPDVHGRPFWKENIKNVSEYEKIIFLGDYTDSYQSDNIDNDTVISCFTEILEFYNNNKDKVILLLGNRDFGYIDNNMISCRHDYKNHNIIKNILENNADIFKIAYEMKIGNNKYLFTHAGIHNKWYEDLVETFGNEDTNVSNYINNLYKYNNNEFKKKLATISNYRDGYSYEDEGSCIWSDIREFANNEKFKDYYQIVGHTRLKNEPIFLDNICDIDIGSTIILDENGTFK